MSDILIRSMEMPKSCDMCWALDDYGDYPRCRITNEQRGYTFPVREKRMSDCPLVPLPNGHGRLIDADELMNRARGCLDELTILSLEFLVNGSSTITPAEGILKNEN